MFTIPPLLSYIIEYLVTVIEMYLITKQTIFLDKNVVIPPNFLLDESLPADMTITSVIHRVPCQPINPQ